MSQKLILISPPSGELIGLSYLYAQTGRALQGFKDDPDEPDGSEDQAGEEEEEQREEEEEPGETVDEGFKDFTVNLDSQFSGPYKSQLPSVPLPPAASQENLDQVGALKPSRHGELGCFICEFIKRLVTDCHVCVIQDCVGPDGTHGYEHVVRLAQSLVARCVKGFVTKAEVEEIVELWEKLPEPDKTPVDPPPRHREELVMGGVKKMKQTLAPSTSAHPGPYVCMQSLCR